MYRLTLAAFGLAATVAAPSGSLQAQDAAPGRTNPPVCSAETLPAAEKAAMEREYARRTREDGKTEADAWLRDAARAFLTRLVDAGACTLPSADSAEVATRSDEEPVGKDGKPCRRTRMENRAVANVSGGPMMMVLVPVCAD